MYVRRVQIVHYGPIDQLDIALPFEDGWYMEELRLEHPKQKYLDPYPVVSAPNIARAWKKMKPDSRDHLYSNLHDRDKAMAIKDLLSERCVLYFPPNRFEEPAWLNEMNLNFRATYMNLPNIDNQTGRRLINYSSLHNNQKWIFDVIYDRGFEDKIKILTVQTPNGSSVDVPVHLGYSGKSTNIFEAALRIIRSVMRGQHIVGVGRRHSRILSVGEGSGSVPIFHLSSGETSLLNLFLSILRDFDLSGASFEKEEDVRGVVVIDEIDLHLHAIHQYEILPGLMRMFPNVQFIVTTHSPLFVLGMNNVFKERGFVLYRLPSGSQISPEEFSEFESAYQAFRNTIRFSDEIRTAVERAQKPTVFMEGETDIRYVKAAGRLLGRDDLLERIDLRDGDGAGNLKKIWSIRDVFSSRSASQRVLLLFDCEFAAGVDEDGGVFKRTIPMQGDHPIHKGIENLFSKSTLEKARKHKPAFIDVDEKHIRTERGEKTTVPERWTVNKDEKTNLCTWLCEYGTPDDFQYFRVIFEWFEELT